LADVDFHALFGLHRHEVAIIRQIPIKLNL